MKPELYEQFLTLKQRGQKEEARIVLLDFIASFQTFEEKKKWVRSFLDNFGFSPGSDIEWISLKKQVRSFLGSSDIINKIRHEI